MGEGLDGGRIVEDENEVGELEADLATKACAAGCDGGRGRPGAVGQAGDDEAGTEAGGAEEAGLDNCEDCEALQRERAVVLVMSQCFSKTVIWGLGTCLC